MDELGLAQADLASVLGRARAGVDGDLAQAVREKGEQLAHLLNGLLKMTRVHAADNRAFDKPAAELARVVNELVDQLGTVHLVTVEDQVYVNDVRIRTDERGGAKDLGGDLKRHACGGLDFHAPLDERGVRSLAAALAAPASPPPERHGLMGRLGAAGLSSVEPQGVFRFRLDSAEEGARPPEEVLRRLVQLVAETGVNLAAGRALHPLPLRRAVIEVLDTGIGAPAFWAPPPAGTPPFTAHAVEVAFLSLLVGRAAGFSNGFLQDLGVAALVHDAGYLLNPAPDAGALARHPVDGARMVLRQRGFHEAKLRRLRAVLDHHRDLAPARGQQPPSAIGLVLRVAEDYANLVRLHGDRVLRSDLAGVLIAAAGTTYHPVLAHVLVNALGRFPPGTRVDLADGRAARVATPARSRELWDKPIVRLLDAAGEPTGELVDVARGPALARVRPG